jgi:hypothetical protein
MVLSSPYESALMILPVGSRRVSRSPVLLKPLPMLPSAIKTMLPLKLGKLV